MGACQDADEALAVGLSALNKAACACFALRAVFSRFAFAFDVLFKSVPGASLSSLPSLSLP